MSQVTHPSVPLSAQIRAHRMVALAVLLALIATAAAVLVLAIANHASTSSAVDTPQSALRADGGPDESNVAAAVGSGRAPAPAASRPDESNVAAAISGN